MVLERSGSTMYIDVQVHVRYTRTCVVLQYSVVLRVLRSTVVRNTTAPVVDYMVLEYCASIYSVFICVSELCSIFDLNFEFNETCVSTGTNTTTKHNRLTNL